MFVLQRCAQLMAHVYTGWHKFIKQMLNIFVQKSFPLNKNSQANFWTDIMCNTHLQITGSFVEKAAGWPLHVEKAVSLTVL